MTLVSPDMNGSYIRGWCNEDELHEIDRISQKIYSKIFFLRETVYKKNLHMSVILCSAKSSYKKVFHIFVLPTHRLGAHIGNVLAKSDCILGVKMVE